MSALLRKAAQVPTGWKNDPDRMVIHSCIVCTVALVCLL